MLTRIGRAAAVAAACLLVAVGGVVLAVVSPAALVGVIMMGLLFVGAADTSGGAARLPVLAPPFLPGTLTLHALCVAWQRSDRSLHGLPAGPARARLIANRERLLDELERRDPVGFRHWLYRGVHASSDPGRHLTENRSGSARTSRRNDSPAP